ncbi:PAS domain S-box protein, partial [archaeon]|nr:PAS domain S-box protein [archaeon]
MKKTQVANKNEILSILYNSAPDVIFLCDTEGFLLQVNEAAEEIIGYSNEELIGKNFFNIELFKPEDIPRVKSNILKTLNNENPDPTEYTIQGKQGNISIIQVRTHLITYQNKPALIGIARDITEIRKKEAIFEAQQKEFIQRLKYQSDILENVMDAVITTDLDSKIISLNKAAVELYGYTEIDAIGKDVYYLLKNEYVGTTRDNVIKTFSETGYWSGEVIQETKTGEKIHISAIVS